MIDGGITFFKDNSEDKMIYFVEMVLMGIFATWFMDMCAKILVKAKLVHPRIDPNGVGRWILYMLRGKFVHSDISQTPALEYEKQATLISHYLIGIGLGGLFLLLEFLVPVFRQQFWVPLLFGFSTVVLPWFWLFPSIGLGIMASNTEKPSDYLKVSSLNHLNFGFGMMIWVVGLRRLFV